MSTGVSSARIYDVGYRSYDGPRRPPRWAILTVALTLPLVLLGTQVTTHGWGMVDQQGLRSPWYFFAQFVEQTELGWLVEHGHRQVGWIAGVCVIILAAALWRWDGRRGVRWLGVTALLAVGIQGVLGIFRIHQELFVATPREKWVTVDDALRKEIETRIAVLGYERLDEWAGKENLEARVDGMDEVDPFVLERLRRK